MTMRTATTTVMMIAAAVVVIKKSGRTTSPFSRYLAELRRFNRTPLGLQLNLYLSGFSEFSGAGIPPHHETNDVTCRQTNKTQKLLQTIVY